MLSATRIPRRLSRPARSAPTRAPPKEPPRPNSAVSSTKSHRTFRRCIPMARRVPISRVRSRMAMAMVLKMPMSTTMRSTPTTIPETSCTPFTNWVNWPISSEAVVTSSFWPIQSSLGTFCMSFIQ